MLVVDFISNKTLKKFAFDYIDHEINFDHFPLIFTSI